MKIYIPEMHIKHVKLKDEEIGIRKAILDLLIHEQKILNLNEEIEWIDIKEKFTGCIIEEENHLETIIFTPFIKNLDNEKLKPNGRNTFLLQNFIAVFKYITSKYSSNPKLWPMISYSLNPFNLMFIKKSFYTSDKLLTQSLLFNIKELVTINVKINKSLRETINNEYFLSSFQNISELLDLKENSKKENLNKNSLYFVWNVIHDELTIYSKFIGATIGEVLMFLLNLQKLSIRNNIKIFFILLEESKVDLLSYFKNSNIIIKNYHELENEYLNHNQTSGKKKIFIRKQKLFEANIIKVYSEEKKFTVKKCFCCNYNLGDLLIRSHINRFADIKQKLLNKLISEDEAQKQNISGYNGFLLCPNHDKMFELGKIIFNENFLQDKCGPFIVNKNVVHSKEQQDYIQETIINVPEMFINIVKNPVFLENISSHKKRLLYRFKKDDYDI